MVSSLFSEEKDLLTLTIKRQNVKQFLELFDALQAVHGDHRVLGWLTEEIVPNLPPDLFKWVGVILVGEIEYERLTKIAATKLVKSLVKKGFKLGQDFSVAADGGLLVTATKSESILQNIPEEFQNIVHIVE